MPTLQAETLQEIASFSEALLTKFSPPEFISGCRVVAVTDINEYATNNGWIEAICGQHNQQRVRWKSGETIGTTNYIDVIHFPTYHLFEAWGLSGTAAIAPPGASWPLDHVITVSATNANADFSDIQAAIDDAGTAAGDVILIDPDAYSPADTILINKAITLTCLDPYGAEIDFSANNKPAVKITAAGGKVVNLNVIHSGAGTTAAALEIAANGAIAENSIFTSNGAPNNGFGIFQSAGTQAEIRNCQCYESGATTLKAGFYNASGTSAVIYGGLFSGAVADVQNVSGATLELANLPRLVNNRLTNAGTISGSYQDNAGNIVLVGSSVLSGIDKSKVSKLRESDDGADALTADTSGNLTITASKTLKFGTGQTVDEFSIDGTLAGNSDTALPTEKAVKTYVDTKLGAWANWTPTVTQSGSVSVTVNFARYKVIDKVCFVSLRLTVTGSGTTGNDIIIGGQPAAAQSTQTGAEAVIGYGLVKDSGTTFFVGDVVATAATSWKFIRDNYGWYLGHDFALAANDTININACYEVS